jgi:putative ABC transport system permease protein
MAFVPLSYNARSLVQRGSATALTVLSIAATVAVLAGMLSLQQGFSTMFTSQGRADLAVFLRPGATSEGESGLPRDRAQILVKETPEIDVGADGQPLASAELFLAVRLFKLDGGETNVAIRGVQPRSFDVHGERLRIIEGQRFAPGADEVIVGRALVGRLRDCHIGQVVTINTVPFRVVGVFEGPGQHQSEIWGDADRMMEALERPVFSRVLARLRPNTDVEALTERLKTDKRVPAKIATERAYLESQTLALSATLVVLGSVLSLLMGTAAIFTGTNAMLASIAARTREIGILLSLGFRPWALFVSFLLEAALLGLVGGVVGCLLVLPLSGIETGTTNFQTFTEIAFAFRATPLVLGISVGFSILLGLLGGAVPAWRAARMLPTRALRRA